MFGNSTSSTLAPQKIAAATDDKKDAENWLAIPLSILSVAFAVTIVTMAIQYYLKKSLKRDLANLMEKKKKTENKSTPTLTQLELLQEGRVKEVEQDSASNEQKKSGEPIRSILKQKKEEKDDEQPFSTTELDTLLHNFYNWMSSFDRCQCGQTISEPEEVNSFEEFLHRLQHLSTSIFKQPEELTNCLVEMVLPALGISLTHWESPSVYGEIEAVAVKWMGKLVNLPDEYLPNFNLYSSPGGGCFTENANESLLMAVLSTCTKKICDVLGRKKADFLFDAPQDMEMIVTEAKRTVVYGNEELFPRLGEICQMAGVELHLVDTKNIKTLENTIKMDEKTGYRPGLIVVSLDERSPLEQLTDLVKSHEMLLHLDCDMERVVLPQNVTADTVNISSKFCTVFFTRNQIIFRSIFSRENPANLNMNNFNLTDWGIHERRQAKGVKIWLKFLILGAEFLSKKYALGSRK